MDEAQEAWLRAQDGWETAFDSLDVRTVCSKISKFRAQSRKKRSKIRGPGLDSHKKAPKTRVCLFIRQRISLYIFVLRFERAFFRLQQTRSSKIISPSHTHPRGHPRWYHTCQDFYSGAAGARLGSATDRGCRRRHRDIGSVSVRRPRYHPASRSQRC